MQQEDVSVKRRKALIAILICAVLLIIAVSFVWAKALKPDYRVDIMNEGSVKKENKDSIISDKDYESTKKAIDTIARGHYGVDKNKRLDVRIRESTYKEMKTGNMTEISFIADVEDIKVSYYVSLWHDTDKLFNVGLGCTSTKEAKYPETFCIGSNFTSSIDANFADKLPYREIENGVQKFIVRKVNNQAKLSLGVDARCDDQTAINNALEKVKKKIAAYGLDPEQVPIETDVNVCRAFEEEQNRKDGGL